MQLCGGLLHHRGESYSLTEEDWVGGGGGSLGERTGEREREGRGGEQKYGIGESRRKKKNKSVTEEMSTPGDGDQAGKMVKSG